MLPLVFHDILRLPETGEKNWSETNEKCPTWRFIRWVGGDWNHGILNDCPYNVNPG